MAKLVLTHKATSRYDDEPGVRYHFPRTYLGFVQRGVGDWCLFYEPRRGGRAAYTGLAFVSDLTPDPVDSDRFYAWFRQPLDFNAAVPFRDGEAGLLKEDGSINKGAFGRSVRIATEVEFERVVGLGFAPVLGVQPSASAHAAEGVAEPVTEFMRPLVEVVTQRPFRDRAFAQQVRSAYDARCALTGVQLINGGGAAEAEAAHIKPVAANGPDSVRNGLSLSRTVHWLFDRGFVSLDDDYRILRTRSGFPDSFGRMLNPTGEALVPANEAEQPHPAFLRWHREHVYKG
jgi:putative restriction endonuclease